MTTTVAGLVCLNLLAGLATQPTQPVRNAYEQKNNRVHDIFPFNIIFSLLHFISLFVPLLF